MHTHSELWNWSQVRFHYPVVPTSRSARRRWVRCYGFPAPVYLTPNHPVWHMAEVHAWFRDRPGNHLDSLSLRGNENVAGQCTNIQPIERRGTSDGAP